MSSGRPHTSPRRYIVISSWPTTVPPGWRNAGTPSPAASSQNASGHAVEVGAPVARRDRNPGEPELGDTARSASRTCSSPRHGVTVPSATSRPRAARGRARPRSRSIRAPRRCRTGRDRRTRCADRRRRQPTTSAASIRSSRPSTSNMSAGICPRGAHAGGKRWLWQSTTVKRPPRRRPSSSEACSIMWSAASSPAPTRANSSSASRRAATPTSIRSGVTVRGGPAVACSAAPWRARRRASHTRRRGRRRARSPARPWATRAGRRARSAVPSGRVSSTAQRRPAPATSATHGCSASSSRRRRPMCSPSAAARSGTLLHEHPLDVRRRSQPRRPGGRRRC